VKRAGKLTNGVLNAVYCPRQPAHKQDEWIPEQTGEVKTGTSRMKNNTHLK
jgi:hypothetical protein